MKLIAEDATHEYLDVRSEGEYAAGHPPKSINIPVMFMGPGGMTPNPDFVKQVEAKFPDKSIALCVGCQSGKRSAIAADQLEKAGYNALVNVEGGFSVWASAGLPVEK